MEQVIVNHASFCVQKEEQIGIVKNEHKGRVITLKIWEYYIVIEIDFWHVGLIDSRIVE